MKAITEAALRSFFKKEPFTVFQLQKGQILTPSAASFLAERRIQIREMEPSEPEAEEPSAPSVPTSRQEHKHYPYVSVLDGGRFEKKPEHMTHLSGNQLIAKDHPRIIFRGKLDSLQSAILLVQDQALQKGLPELSADLAELLAWCREIMKADVLDGELAQSSLLGLTSEELRQHSHNPKKYYGISHILPCVEMGSILLDLNSLRSQVREVETMGVAAFRTEYETRRQDLLQALNRMSSVVYILMVREQAGIYGKKSAGSTNSINGHNKCRTDSQKYCCGNCQTAERVSEKHGRTFRQQVHSGGDVHATCPSLPG